MKKNVGIVKIVLLVLVCPIIIWKLSLGKTYDLYKEVKQAKAQANRVGTGQLDHQKSVSFIADPLLSNGELLRMISSDLEDNGIEVVRYTPLLLIEDDNYKLYSGTLLVQGEFINLVKMIDRIERKHLPIKLSSAHFSYIPFQEEASDVIELTLIFQQVEV